MQKIFLSLFCIWACLPEAIVGECNITSRSKWGSRAVNGTRNVLVIDPPPFVIIHHSDTPQCGTFKKCVARVQQIQNYHMDEKKWADIGYNFLIGDEGTIFEGRGWDIGGAHAPGFNSRSMGICLIGNYRSVTPPDEQLSALESLIECGVDIGKIQTNYHLAGHRQVRATDCPGDKLYELVTKMNGFDPHPV